MTIEKTYKLTIKDTTFNLTEEEVSALYTECGKALKISATNPNWPTYPPGVRKLDDTVVPWPTYPYTHCGTEFFGTTTSGTTDNSVMDGGTSIKSANVPSSKGINFLPDDMETIKENNNWRSSVQKALDKLSAKTNVNFSTNKNGGTKVG